MEDTDDVVYISDDEEETSKTSTKTKNINSYHNVYEHNDFVPESVRLQLEIAEQERRDKQLKKFVELEQEDVVYVPDDKEEEDLLLGPIRELSNEIIYGRGLSSPSKEFPYGLLEQIETHLNNSLRSVSLTTETVVWECVLEVLSCIRFAYNGIIDVCISIKKK